MLLVLLYGDIRDTLPTSRSAGFRDSGITCRLNKNISFRPCAAPGAALRKDAIMPNAPAKTRTSKALDRSHHPNSQNQRINRASMEQITLKSPQKDKKLPKLKANLREQRSFVDTNHSSPISPHRYDQALWKA